METTHPTQVWEVLIRAANPIQLMPQLDVPTPPRLRSLPIATYFHPYRAARMVRPVFQQFAQRLIPVNLSNTLMSAHSLVMARSGTTAPDRTTVPKVMSAS